MEKVTKKIKGLYPKHRHIFRPWPKHLWSVKGIGIKTVGGVVHTRYPLSIHFDSKNAEKMTKFNLWKKWPKNLRTISKPRAYLQTMTKLSTKFRKNRQKTVGELRTQRTHYLLTLIVKTPKKWLSSTCGKSDKNDFRTISRPMHIFGSWKKHL